MIDVTHRRDDIDPCPFCGSSDTVSWESHDAQDNMWCVTCFKCGAEGPHVKGDEEVCIVAWNGAKR